MKASRIDGYLLYNIKDKMVYASPQRILFNIELVTYYMFWSYLCRICETIPTNNIAMMEYYYEEL